MDLKNLSKEQIEKIFENRNYLIKKWTEYKSQEDKLFCGKCVYIGDGKLIKIIDISALDVPEYVIKGQSPENGDRVYKLRLTTEVEEIDTNKLSINTHTIPVNPIWKDYEISEVTYNKVKDKLSKKIKDIEKLKEELKDYID